MALISLISLQNHSLIDFVYVNSSAVFTLVGTLLGGVITFFVTKSTQNRQIEYENKRFNKEITLKRLEDALDLIEARKSTVTKAIHFINIVFSTGVGEESLSDDLEPFREMIMSSGSRQRLGTLSIILDKELEDCYRRVYKAEETIKNIYLKLIWHTKLDDKQQKISDDFFQSKFSDRIDEEEIKAAQLEHKKSCKSYQQCLLALFKDI